jgi:hypothetical protein
MNWLLLSVAVLGIAAVALRRYKPRLEQLLTPLMQAGAPEPALRKITLFDRMIDELKHEKDPLERHRLLSRIVAESYRQRADTAMNKLFLRFAGMHVKELPQMAAALKAASGGQLPAVATFKLLAEALEQDGRREEALSVRQQAAELGLVDAVKVEPTGNIRKQERKIKTSSPPARRAGRRAGRGRVKRRS